MSLDRTRRARRRELSWLAIGATILTLAANASWAVTVEVVGQSGANPMAMTVGETLTLDLRVVADADEVFGLGLSAHGYDESVVDYVPGSGEAVASIFHEFVFPPSTAVGGVDNWLSNPLPESGIGAGGNRVWLYVGTSTTGRTAQPRDPGLDGVIDGGDAQIRLSFEAMAPGVSQIRIGSDYEGDAVVLAAGALGQATGVVIDIVVLGDQPAVPSLHRTLIFSILPALLVLAALAALRRRAVGGAAR